jgi:hypothetical protein
MLARASGALIAGLAAISLFACCSDNDNGNNNGTNSNPQPPTAAFSFNINGLDVQFVDESNDPDGHIVAWEWDFGDGETSNSSDPSHTYGASGGYDVELVVCDNDSMFDTTSQTVVLAPDYTVFVDTGLITGSDVWTWDGSDWGGPPGVFNANDADTSAPEGDSVFYTESGADWGGNTNYAGWGVFLVAPANHTVDLSMYTHLRFWVKSGFNLKVEVQLNGPSGPKYSTRIGSYGWDGTTDWQEIVIPVTAFASGNLGNVFGVFMVTVEGGGRTFSIDHVCWVQQ